MPEALANASEHPKLARPITDKDNQEKKIKTYPSIVHFPIEFSSPGPVGSVLRCT